MTELLLINGADVNLRVPNLENGTAINRAIQLNHIGLVSLLIKRRALLNIKNNNDLGPIEMAQQCEDAHVLTTLRYERALEKAQNAKRSLSRDHNLISHDHSSKFESRKAIL